MSNIENEIIAFDRKLYLMQNFKNLMTIKSNETHYLKGLLINEIRELNFIRETEINDPQMTTNIITRINVHFNQLVENERLLQNMRTAYSNQNKNFHVTS